MAIINCYDVNGNAVRFLTQWDHDISIRATGVKTSPIPEFRFSNKHSQKSKCISGVVVGDGVKVTVPNGFLQEALPIYVQLFYTYPSGDAKTEHTFVIPVKPASMPDGAVYEPVEVRSIAELEKRVKALEENGVPGAGGVPSNPGFDTVSLGGDAGVVIIPEGTADAPAITFYGAHGDEPVALNNVADATDDRSAPNLGQVKQLVEQHSGQSADLSGYAKKQWVQEGFQPKGNYLTSAPVTSVNGKTGAVELVADDVGALPDDTPIPRKTSDLVNDSSFIRADQAQEMIDAVTYALSPQMFGAAGDGETDDTEAIQAMFDSVGDGGLIYFPAGTYVVRHSDTKTGEDYVAVTVRGRRGLRVILSDGALIKHEVTDAGRYTMLRVDGCDGIEISGGVIEGDRQSHQAVTTSYGSKGIHIVDSVNIFVHDMEVRQIFGDCIGVTGATVQCDNVLIDKCTLHDSYRNGITIGGARNSTVRNCHIYGIVGGDPQAGIDLEAERGIANADITIEGCRIHDCGRNTIAFSTNGTGTRVRGCLLDGNTIFDHTHTGVEITGTTITGTANFQNDVVLRGCSVTAVGCYDTTDHPGVSLTAFNTIFGGKDGTPTININGINGVATLRLVGCALNHPESSGYALVYSYNNDNGNVDVMMEGCTVNLRNGTALHRQLAHGKYRAWSMAGCTIAVRSATMDYSFIRTDADQVRISNCTIDLSGVESYPPSEIGYFWKRNSVVEFNGNVILTSVPISNVLCLEGFTGTAHITNNTAPMCGAMVKVAGSSGTVVEKGNITANSAEGSGSGASVTIDTTLTQSGQAADAKAVGDALEGKQPKGEYLTEQKLKTINGQSIVGEGNIEITGGETTEQPEYVRVKYLENTGTQYIDTGYVIQEDDVIEVDYEIPESALSIGTDKILLDARDASNGIRVSTWGSNYKWYARFGHSSGSTSAAYSKQHQTGTFSISKNTLVLNGTTVLSDMPFTAMPTGTLKLFAGVAHDTGAISGPSYSRIIQAKVKRNGETIHCYVSKQRTSDSELGMHDTVTGDFFTNAGTGIFGYAPADVVESTTVQRKPTLTDEQKAAMQALMDDYYNNRGTFYYEFTHNRNAFTSGGSCYTSAKGKFKQCCATFVQNIMMGRSVSDFVGKNASTYSAAITRTPVSDFGYYFDFKYRKYLYGLTDTDENGNTVYYGYNQPNADNYEGSYSYNSYYHPDSTKANKQNFNGFCNANDMARELYEMGCEIPFSELDVGDIIFTLDNDLSDNSSMLNFHAWRNIYHVGMVYDVKQIDASSKEIYYIECTSYFDVDNRPIEKPFLSSSQMDLRFKAFKLTEDMAFCARMPVAFGYEPNVPDRITTSAVP